MGLFDRPASKADVDRAADAVQRGNPTREQRELNDRIARNAGGDGNRAREAQQGRLRR